MVKKPKKAGKPAEKSAKAIDDMTAKQLISLSNKAGILWRTMKRADIIKELKKKK